MQDAPRRWFTACVGHALLAAMLLCPVMAVAEHAPAPASCHDEGRGEHGDHAAALTCCATIMKPASVHRVHEADAALPAAAGCVQVPAPRADYTAALPLPPPIAPPLFLQHASLLI